MSNPFALKIEISMSKKLNRLNTGLVGFPVSPAEQQREAEVPPSLSFIV